MNKANEVRPIFRSLGDIAQATGYAIVLIGHLNKAAKTQSTYRGLGSIDITAAVRSLLFIGKRGKDGKVFIDTLKLPPCLVPLYRPPPDDEKSPGIFHLQEDFE